MNVHTYLYITIKIIKFIFVYLKIYRRKEKGIIHAKYNLGKRLRFV